MSELFAPLLSISIALWFLVGMKVSEAMRRK